LVEHWTCDREVVIQVLPTALPSGQVTRIHMILSQSSIIVF